MYVEADYKYMEHEWVKRATAMTLELVNGHSPTRKLLLWLCLNNSFARSRHGRREMTVIWFSVVETARAGNPDRCKGPTWWSHEQNKDIQSHIVYRILNQSWSRLPHLLNAAAHRGISIHQWIFHPPIPPYPKPAQTLHAPLAPLPNQTKRKTKQSISKHWTFAPPAQNINSFLRQWQSPVSTLALFQIYRPVHNLPAVSCGLGMRRPRLHGTTLK